MVEFLFLLFLLLALLLFVLGASVFFLTEAVRHDGKKNSLFSSFISIVPIFAANALWLITATPEERGHSLYLAITLSMLSVQIITMFSYNTTIIVYSGLGGKKAYWYLLPGVIYGVFIHYIHWGGLSVPRWSTFATIEIFIFWLTVLYIVIGAIYNINMRAQRKNK